MNKCRAGIAFVFLNVLLTFFLELSGIRDIQYYELSYGVADGLVSCLNVRIAGMCGVLSAITAEIVLFRNDFKMNYVIRSSSRCGLFLGQIVEAAVFSLASTLAVQAVTVMTYLFYSGTLIDWNCKSSVFHATLRRVSDAGFVTVLTMTTICYFTVLFSAMAVFLIMRWIFRNYLPGFVTFLLVIGYDSIEIDRDRLVFSATKLVSYYSDWNNPLMMLVKLLLFLLMSLAIISAFSRSGFVNRGKLC